MYISSSCIDSLDSQAYSEVVSSTIQAKIFITHS